MSQIMTKRTLAEGESVQVQGNHGIYTIKKVRGVISCSCPAWLHQSLPIDKRTCKHITALLGEGVDSARVANAPVREHVPVIEKKKNVEIMVDKDEPSSPAPIPTANGESISFMLADTWDGKLDPTGMWMSEKLDGVRARWIASKRKFISRNGNEYFAPEWFTRDLPPFDLDGELWGGRGKFQSTVSVVRSADSGEAWKGINYAIFDAPAINEMFEVRIGVVKKFFGTFPAHYVIVLEQTKCASREHLAESLEKILKMDGEGIILRQAGSMHVGGRSSVLLKVKPVRDLEAKVITLLPGTGKYAELVGKLEAVMPNGKTFRVGSGLSDADRKNPPPVGSVITIGYQEFTEDGKPRFPRFLRVRTDVRWEDVCKNWKEPKAAPHDDAYEKSTAMDVAEEAVKSISDFVALSLSPQNPEMKAPRMAVLSTIPIISHVPIPVVIHPPALAPQSIVPNRNEPAPRSSTTPPARVVTMPQSSDGITTDGVLYSYAFNDSLANSHKYWKVQVNGSSMTTIWGRIGTAGQSQTKSFPSAQLALKEAGKKRHEKEREGYRSV